MKAVFWVGRHARIARLVYGLRFKGLGVALPPWRNQMRKSSNQTTSAWQEIRGVRRTHGKRNLWDQPIARTLEREREREETAVVQLHLAGAPLLLRRICAPLICCTSLLAHPLPQSSGSSAPRQPPITAKVHDFSVSLLHGRNVPRRVHMNSRGGPINYGSKCTRNSASRVLDDDDLDC
jgi:hypothetical protein